MFSRFGFWTHVFGVVVLTACLGTYSVKKALLSITIFSLTGLVPPSPPGARPPGPAQPAQALPGQAHARPMPGPATPDPRPAFCLPQQERAMSQATCQLHRVQNPNDPFEPTNRNYSVRAGYCRSRCCHGCAAGPGVGLRNFSRQLLSAEKRTFVVKLLGDSVAYQNEHMVTRTFLEAMHRHFPRHVFDFHGEYRYPPDFAYFRIASGEQDLTQAAVIIVHFNKLTGHLPMVGQDFASSQKIPVKSGAREPRASPDHAEALLRLLLALPQRPLVVLIQHCTYLYWPDAYNKQKQKHMMGWVQPGGVEGYEEDVRRTRALARYYGLTTVSACAAMETLLTGSCASEPGIPPKAHHDAFFRHHERMDAIHYNVHGSGMLGCILADAVWSAASAAGPSERPYALPPPLEPLDAFRPVLLWSVHNGQLKRHMVAHGWRQQQGGAGGKKVWLEATEPGASVQLRLPPCTRVAVEFYKHPDLPMGLVEAAVDGRGGRSLDACCSKACRDTPAGQGQYFFEVVADGLAFKPHTLTLTLAKRSDTTCAKMGSKFDLRSVVAMAPQAQG